MLPNQVFAAFVTTFDSRQACAAQLRCSYALVAAIVNGHRSVSKDIADKANSLRPEFTRDALLFGTDDEASATLPAKAA
jgi:hypothetical protein